MWGRGGGGGWRWGRKHVGNVIVIMWIVCPQVEHDYQQWSLPLGNRLRQLTVLSACCPALFTLFNHTHSYTCSSIITMCMWVTFAQPGFLLYYVMLWHLMASCWNSGVTWILLCTWLQAWEVCQEASRGWLRHLLQGHQWTDCGMPGTHMNVHVVRACIHAYVISVHPMDSV